MAKQTATTGGAYLYAVVDGAEAQNLGPLGLFEGDVYAVSDEDISALVSNLPSIDRLRPERRHIAAHQAVLSRLVEENRVVLPVSFGTVAEGESAVRRMLDRYHSEFIQQIKRVKGKVEMELRLAWDVANLFEYLIGVHPELKTARDRIFENKRTPSRDEKIELGQLFERILNEEREKHTRTVEEALSGVCTEIKRNKCRNEQEIARLSCLIEKGNRQGFEEALQDMSQRFDDSFVFEHSGPFPPYNFIDIRLKV